MLCFALVIAGCGSDEEEPAAQSTPTEEATPAANEFLPEGCENVEKPEPKTVEQLQAPKEKLDAMLVREGRAELARACFEFLPHRARLDLSGWAEQDIFAHS